MVESILRDEKRRNQPLPDRTVSIVSPAPRDPLTAIERLALSALLSGAAATLGPLIERVARALYEEEVARGAHILDLGLFGPGLFTREVADALAAANGVLWRFDP